MKLVLNQETVRNLTAAHIGNLFSPVFCTASCNGSCDMCSPFPDPPPIPPAR